MKWYEVQGLILDMRAVITTLGIVVDNEIIKPRVADLAMLANFHHDMVSSSVLINYVCTERSALSCGYGCEVMFSESRA